MKRLFASLLAAAALLAAVEASTAAHGGAPARAASTAPVAPAVDATNRLAVTLLPRLGGGGDTVFSPYSIATALAMIDQGAAAATATQIGRVLGSRERHCARGQRAKAQLRVGRRRARRQSGRVRRRPRAAADRERPVGRTAAERRAAVRRGAGAGLRRHPADARFRRRARRRPAGDQRVGRATHRAADQGADATGHDHGPDAARARKCDLPEGPLVESVRQGLDRAGAVPRSPAARR